MPTQYGPVILIRQIPALLVIKYEPSMFDHKRGEIKCFQLA